MLHKLQTTFYQNYSRIKTAKSRIYSDLLVKKRQYWNTEKWIKLHGNKTSILKIFPHFSETTQVKGEQPFFEQLFLHAPYKTVHHDI